MLIRRKIITPAPEQEVVVVKPRKPAGLYAMLGTATLCAVGLIGYMTYAIFQEGQNDGEQASAMVAPAPSDGRAQRFNRTDQPAAKPPTTIIVNPPAIIHTPPPVVVQPKQPDTPIIVQGSSAPPEPPVKKTPPPDEDPPEDVDGTVQGGGD